MFTSENLGNYSVNVDGWNHLVTSNIPAEDTSYSLVFHHKGVSQSAMSFQCENWSVFTTLVGQCSVTGWLVRLIGIVILIIKIVARNSPSISCWFHLKFQSISLSKYLKGYSNTVDAWVLMVLRVNVCQRHQWSSSIPNILCPSEYMYVIHATAVCLDGSQRRVHTIHDHCIR